MDKFDETLAIVTGCSGGIGSEICKALANSNSKIQVVGLDVTSPKYEISNFKFYKCDITNITAQCGERFKEVNKILQLDSIFFGRKSICSLRIRSTHDADSSFLATRTIKKTTLCELN